MSSELSAAIYARLGGLNPATGLAEVLPVGSLALAAQVQLATLLAVDPRTVGNAAWAWGPNPAVFRGNKRLSPLCYPCITFRQNSGHPEHAWGTTAAVDTVYYDFEIWSNDTGGNVISDIGEQLSLLLDMRRQSAAAAPLPLSGGYCWHMESFITLSDPFYDQELNAWFGLWRVKAIEGRQ